MKARPNLKRKSPPPKRVSRLPCGKGQPYRNAHKQSRLRLHFIGGIASLFFQSLVGKAKPFRTEGGLAAEEFTSSAGLLKATQCRVNDLYVPGHK